jgi:predicted RNA-binding protein with PUA-like domain
VVRAAYPDPKRPQSKFVVVDLEPAGRLESPVTLAAMKALPIFADSPLVRQGRLSVVPLTAAQWKAIAGRSGR